jgi:light-regulated signal transduction histidine kinase (bacteriophytochrome)
MHQFVSMDCDAGESCFPSEELAVVLRRENEALTQQVSALNRSNADLEQFAWTASHDLKEPLRTVASYTQLLLRRRPPAPGSEDAEFAAFIVQGVERMRAMIDGLLAYAHVGRDQEFGPPSDSAMAHSVYTADIAAEAVEALQSLMQECQASVLIAPLPPVAVAPTPLLQIFSNLIGNALKYRIEGAAPRVEILAEREACAVADGPAREMVRFAVRDNGIGIDPEFHERIFGPFHRLHGDEYPGIGLGLSLTRRLVERYGGQIWVESEAGAGSTFYFTLPAAPVRDAAPAAPR